MRGFTLVEILITVGLLGIIVAGIFSVLTIADMQWHIDDQLMDVQRAVHSALDGMSREIRMCSPSKCGITITESDTKISFCLPDNNNPITYFLDFNTQQIIRQYASTPNRILANDITQLSFEDASNIITISLTAQNTFKQRTVTYPARTQVRVRNE